LGLFDPVSVTIATERAMESVHVTMKRCAYALHDAVKGVPHDGGRFIHALDTLLVVKHTVEKALEMPHSVPAASK
jgi:hypothetical protein